MQIYSSRSWENPDLVAGSRLVHTILLPADQQHRSRYVQCICQSLKVIQADITFAAFDGAYVGAVQPALFGELLLAPAVQTAKITYIA